MKNLTDQQRDALAELINIGFGRAANALSILVEQRVLLEAPQVNLYPLVELKQALEPLAQDEITSVHQVFSGKLSGDAILLMNSQSASALSNLLGGGTGTDQPKPMSAVDHEAIRETGNILLNAFTGSFGNLLQVHITFTVPSLHCDSLQNMVDSLTIDQRGLTYALLVKVNFRLTQGDVFGYVVIVMGLHSLESLIEAMRINGYIP
jgi:chemotaxis protein CheC